MWKILSNQKQEKVILLNHTRRGWKWKKNFSAIFCYLNIVAIASLFLFIYYYFFHIRFCYIFCEIAHISGRWMFVIYVVVVSICQQKKMEKKRKNSVFSLVQLLSFSILLSLLRFSLYFVYCIENIMASLLFSFMLLLYIELCSEFFFIHRYIFIIFLRRNWRAKKKHRKSI